MNKASASHLPKQELTEAPCLSLPADQQQHQFQTRISPILTRRNKRKHVPANPRGCSPVLPFLRRFRHKQDQKFFFKQLKENPKCCHKRVRQKPYRKALTSLRLNQKRHLMFGKRICYAGNFCWWALQRHQKPRRVWKCSNLHLRQLEYNRNNINDTEPSSSRPGSAHPWVLCGCSTAGEPGLYLPTPAGMLCRALREPSAP